MGADFRPAVGPSTPRTGAGPRNFPGFRMGNAPSAAPGLGPTIAPPCGGRGRGQTLFCREVVLRNPVRRFVGEERGEDLIEYGLLGSFVAAVALVTLISDPLGIRSSLVAVFQRAAEALYMAAQGDLSRL